MCQTPEQGGKKCSPCTRPRYEALISAMDTARGFPRDIARHSVRRTFRIDGENATNVIANYGSTPTGAKHITTDITRYANEGDKKTADVLRTGLKLGSARLAAANEAKQVIVKAERAARNSMAELVRHRGTFETSLAGRYPVLAAMWIRDKNKGFAADEVAAKSNAGVWLRCPDGHEMYNRLNNWANGLDAGRMPYCEACRPRRNASFKNTQRSLQRLLDVVGNNAAALNTLSPALQYRLLQFKDCLSGSRDSVNRQIGMSLITGKLTFAEVMKAQDLTSIEKKVCQTLDEDDLLATIADGDLQNKQAVTPQGSLADLVAASAALSVFDADADLAETFIIETIEKWWEYAYPFADPGSDPRAYLGHLSSLCETAGGNPATTQILNRFVAEYEAVLDMALPETYRSERIDETGVTRTVIPRLSQRRFAYLANQKRRFMNLSGTGAGKTLATALAVQIAGARETLVVCPKDVCPQWVSEFEQGYGTSVEVHNGLPPAEPLPEPAAGVNRVWVVNYDKLGGDTGKIHPSIDALADRVDAIVYDEIHMTKRTGSEAQASKRRRALIRFTDRAGDLNANLLVIGASATPVVNNLDEARSILRLVEGPASEAFQTKPTIHNAAIAYQRMRKIGFRQLPDYAHKTRRHNKVVDITDNLRTVYKRVQQYRALNDSSTITPLTMEAALLPEKIDEIVRTLRSNELPTVVYTHYVDDSILVPLRTGIEEAGFRVGMYTGKEQGTARRALLAAFANGEIDVLIGSQPIATGIDGLQFVSHHMIVASMGWTAAHDDQLVGRLSRFGQTRDVTITYILTEAKAGKSRWSWCKDHRQRRIEFKRDIANAAVDGILPAGTLETTDNSAQKAFAAMAKLIGEPVSVAV